MTKAFKFFAIIILFFILMTPSLLPAHAVQAASQSTTMTVGASSLNVRSTPSRSARVTGSLKKGTPVQAFNSKYGWTYVQTSGITGWVSSAYLIKSHSARSNTNTSGVVTGGGLRLRQTPSLKGKVIKSLTKGTRVSIEKKQSDWLNVKTEKGYKGWVSQSFIKTTATGPSGAQVKTSRTQKDVTVLTNGVNLRKGPSTSYMVVGYASKGQTYQSLGTQNNWVHIALKNGGDAWIASWLVGTSSSTSAKKESSHSGDLQGRTFVIDAGHGGFDGGAMGVMGTLEKNATLAAATTLASKLNAAGADVIMTRQSDIYLSLSERVNVSAAYRTDAFISLHYNSSLPSVRGTMTFYYSSKKDKPLAQAVQSHLISQTRTMNDGVRFGDFHVLRENPKRSILIELGFLSNYNEENLVTSSRFQNNAADGIVAGLEDYFN